MKKWYKTMEIKDSGVRREFDSMDSCVMCGEYVPEGRQVCPACELTRPKEQE